jgi:hypothetical protein
MRGGELNENRQLFLDMHFPFETSCASLHFKQSNPSLVRIEKTSRQGIPDLDFSVSCPEYNNKNFGKDLTIPM